MLNVKKCVNTCMNKYNLSKEEALRIATTDNILLSIKELRYKYDNMNIGKSYPEWLTPEEHLRMCYATIWKKYNSDFFWHNDCDDIAYDLFVYTSIHLHNYKDKYQLNGLLLCRLKNIIRDDFQEEKCYAETYDWELERKNEEVNANKYVLACTYGALSKETTDTAELLITIKSIKNDIIKGTLLISGYFLADIQEFLLPLTEFYFNSSDTVKRKIYDLGRDDKYFCDIIHREVNLDKKENVTIGRILKVFNKRDKSYLQTDILPYLKTIGLGNI